MLMTTVQRDQPFFFENLDTGYVSGDTAVYKKILLPFESGYLLGTVLGAGLEKARQSMAELVLLQLSQRDLSDEGCLGQESIFSMLRGLHTQLQQLPVKVSIDTAVDVSTKSIAEYIEAHNIDLIIISDDQIEPEDESAIASELQTIESCPTYIVRAN